eukprot:15467926-Alexandrium_andersonii.AAC.1
MSCKRASQQCACVCVSSQRPQRVRSFASRGAWWAPVPVQLWALGWLAVLRSFEFRSVQCMCFRLSLPSSSHLVLGGSCSECLVSAGLVGGLRSCVPIIALAVGRARILSKVRVAR